MIRRQVTVPTSPEHLWETLTDPDRARGWFGGTFEWELGEGRPLRFEGDDGTIREGRVEAVRPERHLRFQWWPSGGDEHGEDASEVTYLLEPEGESTRFTVQERRIGAPSPGVSSMRASATSWTAWDGRLAGAWAGVVAATTGVRA